MEKLNKLNVIEWEIHIKLNVKEWEIHIKDEEKFKKNK